MSDVIVLRHYESGFAKRAAAVSWVVYNILCKF